MNMRSPVNFLTALALLFFSSLSALVVQAGLLTQLNFIPSQCIGDLEGSQFSCVTMHGIATFTNEDTSRIQTNIISYVDPTGNTVYFETPIGLDISISNVTATLLFLNSKVVYNGYEEYEPGEACTVARNYGLCHDPKTKPTGENKILCCLDRSRRGMGAHCYRNDYTQKYYLYDGVWTSESSPGRVAITQRGKTLEFKLDSPTFVHSIANEGVASIHSEYDESSEVFYSLSKRVMRDARDGALATDRDKYFVISSETESYLNAAKYWAQHSTCHDYPGKFALHDIKEHIRDQFYVARNDTVFKVLKRQGAQYPETLEVLQSSNDVQQSSALRLKFPPDLSLVTFQLFNIVIKKN